MRKYRRSYSIYRRRFTKPHTIIGVLSILLLVLLAAVACGGDAATPTIAAPAQVLATAETIVVTPTGGLRPLSEWTVENPGTLQEIEAELEKRRGEPVNWVSWGGSFQDAQRKAYLNTLRARFGINVVEHTPPNLAQLKAMVESDNVTWDILQIPISWMREASAEGTLQELDRRIVDSSDHFGELGTSPFYGGGTLVFAMPLTYNTDAFTDETAPKSWVDYFDPNFLGPSGAPARRNMGNYMSDHFVLGLLGAGFTPEDVLPMTPEKEEISFRSFAQLAPLVTAFTTTNQEPIELLAAGELDMAIAANGRVVVAQKEGAPLKMCWTCGYFLSLDGEVLAKDAPNAELANLVLGWISYPEINSQLTMHIAYSPGNSKSGELLEDLLAHDPVTLQGLPTYPGNLPYSFLNPQAYLGENFDRLNERYLAIFQQE